MSFLFIIQLLMEIKEQLVQLQNFDDLSSAQLTKWMKALDSPFVSRAGEMGFKEDLAVIALMTTSVCTSFQNLMNVLHDIYIYRLYDTDYFLTVENLRVHLHQLREKIFHKATRHLLLCVVCKEHKVDTAFLFCGHIVVCNKCSNLTTCPICKCFISEHVKIYY